MNRNEFIQVVRAFQQQTGHAEGGWAEGTPEGASLWAKTSRGAIWVRFGDMQHGLNQPRQSAVHMVIRGATPTLLLSEVGQSVKFGSATQLERTPLLVGSP